MHFLLVAVILGGMEHAAALPSRDRPLPAEMLVRDALAAFLAENGYDAADYDAPRTPAKLLGVRFSVPNPPRHRWSIMRHDGATSRPGTAPTCRARPR